MCLFSATEPIDDKLTLVQIMVWCHNTAMYCLSQCWSISMSPHGVIRPQWAKLSLAVWEQFKYEFQCQLTKYSRDPTIDRHIGYCYGLCHWQPPVFMFCMVSRFIQHWALNLGKALSRDPIVFLKMSGSKHNRLKASLSGASWQLPVAFLLKDIG